ncbi:MULTISPECIES: hypothetical protein [unclassified Mycoplasma]|uniref:hypothetical protein n=1 Tax=unclassified Mycoplasma TaxID=2683645 RepID=UPI00211C3533|nr:MULTISPECIES: hypothetical protein [unclassified Mycoplasma]UUM20100.1 hypothetical protein NPA11_01585 [Mycoplasma sp. 1578d]UUM25080.1 hypothetical protein NPA12_01560 [Mycoplasma sp. 3686d]
MLKIKNKKLAKTLVISSSIAAPLAVSLGATLFLIHSKENINSSTVFGNFLQGENLFKLYAPYIEASQNDKEQVLKQFSQAKNIWNDKETNLQEKLVALDKAQEKVFNFYINNVDQLLVENIDQSKSFWKKVLNNQEARIRELDLKNKLTQLKQDRSMLFIHDFDSLNSEQRKEYLTTLSSEISKLVLSQNDKLNPFIKLLQATSNQLDTLPFNGLKKDANNSLVPLYSRIISANIRLNEVQIASQDTKNEVKKLEKVLAQSKSEINEINDYLKQIEPYVKNTAYTQSEKENVKKFLDSTKINLDIALTQADINKIRNDVVTFYQQISDTQKTSGEIKQVISDLNTYIDQLDPMLRFNKDTLKQLITQVLSISDKKELISAKSDLFSQFYALKFSNQVIHETNQKIDQALKNNIITPKKSILLKSQIQAIVNKNLPAKELSNELFNFYNSEDKELERLDYLNNELKLIQSQIKLVKELPFTNQDIISKLNELDNQVVQTYSNSVTSAFLVSVKNQLNESLRTILKNNLSQLIDLMNQHIKQLASLNNDFNKVIISEAQKLNDESTPLTKDFDPVPSAKLIEQIKTYNIKLQNLINASKQTQAEDFSNFTDDYLRTVFSNNDNTYVPTEREQKRIDLYNSYKKRLDELRAKINSGDGNADLAQEIESISQKLKNLSNTGNDFRGLSLLDQSAEQIVQEQSSGPNSIALEPFIKDVQKTRDQLDSLFANPDATPEQVASAHENLQKVLKALTQADTKILLEQKINQLKNAIDQSYGSDLSSDGAQALLKQYNDLVQASKDTSNQQRSNDSISKANHLIELTPYLFDAEVNKKRLLDIIGEKTSAQYSGVKTTNAIGKGNDEIISVDQLLKRLNSSDNIPNLQAFENAKTQLLERGNEILLAYEQDKIEILNSSIQSSAKTTTGEANDVYKSSLAKINQYATVQKSQLNLERAKAAGEKMDLFNQLANISSHLLDSYNLYNSGSTTTLSNYIGNLLSNNDLATGDDVAQIKEKITTLTKAQNIIQAKKEFLDVYQQLEVVLNKNKEWKIYEPLKLEINLLIQQANTILFNNDLSVEQIQAQRDQFKVKINLYQTKKADLESAFNQAIAQVDAKEQALNADALANKNANPSYSFEQYYKAAKRAYVNDKSPAQRVNVDTQDINDHLVKLQIGFEKDRALNKLKDIAATASSSSFGNSTLHTKVQGGQSTFDSSVKNQLNLSSLSLQDTLDNIKKITRYSELFNLEKRVADYVVKNQNSSSNKTFSIEQLTNALEISLPISSDTFDDLDNKYKELNKVYLQEVGIQEIRERIIATLENDDLNKGALGIVRELANNVGATYDTDVNNKLTEYVANTKNTANTATDKQPLIDILNQVNRVKDEIPAIATLAKNVDSAKSAMDAINNNSSSLISTYIQKINTFLTEAKANYFKITVPTGSDNNIEYYNDLSHKIIFSTQKLNAADQLASKLAEIQTIINGSDFNLRSVDGVAGIDKLNELNTYLTSFETAAINDQYDQAGVDKITTLTAKAGSFKNVINADHDALTYATTLAQNNSSTSSVDLKAILLLVWDSIPSATTNPNTTLGKETNNTYSVNDLFELSSNNTLNQQAYNTLAEKIITEIGDKKAAIQARNAYRDATHTQINTIKQTQFIPLVHNELKNSLISFLNQLDQENNTSTTLTLSPNETGTLNVVRAKVNIIQNKLQDLKNLAQQAHELNDFKNKIVSNLDLINNAKTQAQTLIDRAQTYYNDTSKMSVTGNDSIANLIAQIEQQQAKLTLLVAYEQVKNEFEADTTLTQPAKNVINGKLQAFVNEYNTNNQTAQQLITKYFRSVNNVQASEPASAKNSLIKYALDNAIELQKAYNRANGFIVLKDPSLDNNNVESKFNQITTLINNSTTGVNATLSTNNNDEVTKLTLISTINNNIDQLIQAKKAQIQEQLDTDNQIKNFFDSVNTHFNTPGTTPSTYVDRFEQKGINDLTTANNDKDNLSYSQINVYLANAKSVASLQIFDLYNRGINVVENIKNTVNEYYNDFDASKVAVRAGSQVGTNEYAPILALKNQIDNVLNNNFTVIDDYSSKINSLVGVITGNYQSVIDAFIDHIKQSFAEKFAPIPTQTGANNQAGFYIKLKQKLDPLKQNIMGKQQNLYKYNQVESLETQYDAFVNSINSAVQIYNSINAKKESGSLAYFATVIERLNHDFIEFEKSVKNAVAQALSKNPLEPIFADIFETIRYSDTTSNPDTAQIIQKFQGFKQGIETLKNNVNTDPNFDFATLNKTTNIPDTLYSLLQSLTAYKDWITLDDNKQLLLKSLDDNPNQTNDFMPTEQSLNDLATFDKKYKVIVTNKSYTRSKFVSKFNEIIAQNTNNGSQPEMVEIHNNPDFLDMFEQFAYTSKDVTSDNQVKSIYSPIKFKVYIKKYDQNGWFSMVAPTQAEVDRQSLKAKIVYSYESQATDIGTLKVEKEVVMTFQTLDKIQITNGTTSIFVNNNNQAGYAAKYEVIDVDEAGWNIPQVSSASASNAASVKNDVITKVYNKMKSAIFNLNSTNSTENTSTHILEPNSKYKSTWQNSTDPALANLNSTTTGSASRISAYLDKDNRNTNNRYSFDIENQSSIPITFNLSLTTSKDDERLVIIPKDNEKGFAFLQLQPGYITGFPTHGAASGTGTPEIYDFILRELPDSGGQNLWNDSSSWWNTPNSRIPTGINVILYEFNIDYDPVLRKVYLYNSWMENVFYGISKNAFKSNLDIQKTKTELKTDDQTFLNQLSNNFGSNPANYTPTPAELSRTIQIYSIFNNQVMPDSGSSLLFSSSTKFPGVAAVYPLNGGQKAVFRSNPNTPTTAQIAPTPNKEFSTNQNPRNSLQKSSARGVLYSATIGEFWFKLR